MKIVINTCWGGFGLSDEAAIILKKDKWDPIDRTDADLIALIEERGSEFVSGYCANLEIFEIPDEATDWQIDEYDGNEGLIAVINGKIERFR